MRPLVSAAIASVAVAVVALAAGCTPERSNEGAPAPSGSARAPASASAGVAASSIAPASSAVAAAPAPLTPEQEKQAQSIVVRDCVPCHAEELFHQQRLTPKQWGTVVKKMQGWGSQVEPSNVDMLVAFLAARYGTSTSPYVPREIDAAAAAGAIAALPDGPFAGGDAKKGETLYTEACASCHGKDARGSATGMNLADRPGLYRAVDFAAMVQKGRGRMPAYPMYKDAEIGALLAYLRTLRPG